MERPRSCNLPSAVFKLFNSKALRFYSSSEMNYISAKVIDYILLDLSFLCVIKQL